MKKGIRGHDVSATGLKNISERCREVGIEYIQLVLDKSIEDFKSGEYSPEYAQAIKEELGESKIAILGSYINLSDPDAEALSQSLAKFKEKIRYATILKPIAVGSETGMYIEGKTHSEEAYQYLLKNVKELVCEAEKFGVNVGIEGVHYLVIDSPEKMARLINDVNSENLKVIFDPCNLINIRNYKEQDKIISDMFDLFADKIVAIHVKDFIVQDGKIKKANPGEGILNYKLILEKMREKKLDIPMISEGYSETVAEKAFSLLSKYE